MIVDRIRDKSQQVETDRPSDSSPDRSESPFQSDAVGQAIRAALAVTDSVFSTVP